MSMSKVITFLVAGIVVGAVLFFAGFGVLNLFQKSPDAPVATDQPVVTQAPKTPPVNPPTIEVTNQAAGAGESNQTGAQQGQGTSRSPIKIKPLNGDSETVDNAEPAPAIAFGTLMLSTINSANNAPVNADFLIENSDNVVLAWVKDTASSTLSLPVGDYKITVSHGEQKVIRFLGVKDSQNGSEVFELDVPTLTGEAAAGEAAGSESPEALVGTTETATAQVEPTETAASGEPNAQAENNASDVPASSASNEQANNESTTETSDPSTETSASSEANSNQGATSATSAQPATPEPAENSATSQAVGGLRMSALTKQGKRPMAASFYIQRLNGENVEIFRNVKTQQITLPAGTYRVTAKADKASLTKQVEVLATRGVHEIFLIPDQSAAQQSTAPAQSQTDNATPNTAAPATPRTDDKKQLGLLELFAKKATNGKPLKSNFYVQMPNGTMVASKTYVDSIGYKLPAGKYKIIVRATGYKNKAITLNVREGQTRREVFKLESTNQSGASNSQTPATQNSSVQTATTGTSQNVRAYGGLTVNVVSETGADLPADIVITQRDGTPLKQAAGVASASFDLPPREFLIRVTYDGFTTSHQVNVVAGKLAIKTISFETQRMSRRERRQRQERSQ